MSKNVQVSSGNAGFCGLLTIVFITLKLCGVIAWSWWWVFAPLWMPLALVLGILLIGLIIAGVAVLVASGIDKMTNRRKRKK